MRLFLLHVEFFLFLGKKKKESEHLEPKNVFTANSKRKITKEKGHKAQFGIHFLYVNRFLNGCEKAQIENGKNYGRMSFFLHKCLTKSHRTYAKNN